MDKPSKPLRPPGLSYAPTVRGWLLLFCLTLFFVNPYFLLQSFSAGFRAADTIKNDYPRVETIAFVNSFLAVALMALSIRAGYRLWVVSSGAVVTAKRFLLILWTTNVVLGLLPFTAGLPRDANLLMLKPFFWGLVKTSAYCGLWWLYLGRSKRVDATYGPHARAAPSQPTAGGRR